MKITFLGAAHEVTGSCTLIQVGKVRFVVDCGMEQGRDMFENQTLPVNAADVDFALLTHAHIDHSGNLPLLYKNGFRGSVYATEATCSLCGIMLRDSAHIQMSEAEYKSRKLKRSGKPEQPAVYDMADAEALIKNLRPCGYGEQIQVAEGVIVRFSDVGHLLGSACIEVWMTENGVTKKMVFSGDVGNLDQPILRDPQTVAEADYVMVESTYGDRLHSEEKPDYVGSLAGFIQKALDRGGNVVIPSFAVGRTQELLYFIRQIKLLGLVKGHDGFKVFVDSPLAADATSVFLQCDPSFMDDDARELLRQGVNPLYFEGLETCVSADESKALNFDAEPKVIISASGMCDAGRIRHHLKHNLWRPEALVLFVGYQSEGTLGRTLYEGAKQVKMFGEEIAVRAEIDLLPGISGHADKNGLLRWMRGFEKAPTQVFVNHGEDASCEAFAAALKEELGFNAAAPWSGTEYDLLSGAFVKLAEPRPIIREEPERKTAAPAPTGGSAFGKLLEAVERLLRAARRCEGRANRELGEYTRRVDALADDMER